MQKELKQVIAEIHLLARGGRRRGIRSGYRCTLKFGNLYSDAGIYLLEGKEASPGQTFFAKVIFPNPNYVASCLTNGATFLVTEGINIVGRGRIVRV